MPVVALASALFAVTPAIANPTATTALKSNPAARTVRIVNMAITEAEVLAAQKAWGNALVAISMTYDQQGHAAAKTLAEKVIDTAYGYQMGTVLFKPTLTEGDQTFRLTREGALAYFVGGNSAFPADRGFALNGWRKVEIQNVGIIIAGNVATTMGNVLITDKTGKVTTVDKTWQFIKDERGNLRILLHHSSLPYTSKK
ncbi:MAG: phosphoribosyl-AMP cyclohydrolase [Synechococcales bacterium]|nr:phosphoribosyl-AMP cyclohydrolase [Synechococcales bacterium]